MQLVPDASGVVAARLVENTSLISPVFAVDPRAQTLAVTVRSRGASSVVEVTALPVDGPPVPLGVVVPEATLRTTAFNVAAIAGRSVRLQIDPTPTFGGAVEVFGVGPLAAPLPGWTVVSGAPTPVRLDGRAALAIDGEPFSAARSDHPLGKGAGAVLVSARGAGTLSTTVDGRTRRITLGDAWRDLRIAVAPGPRRVALSLKVDPGGDEVFLRDIGRQVRRVTFTGLVARRTGRTVEVRGRARGAPRGTLLTISAAGSRDATARVVSGSRFRALVRTRQAAVTVAAVERLVIAAPRAVRVSR